MNACSFRGIMLLQPQRFGLAMLSASQAVATEMEILMQDYSTLPLFSLQPETKEIPLTQTKYARISAADHEWLSRWRWHALNERGRWYAARTETLPDGTRRNIKMHRVILDAPPDIEVDHRDGDGLNNTRENLRFVTSSQNRQNSRLRIGSVSGYKGVDFHKATEKWRARIKLNGKQTYLGLYGTAVEAAISYDRAACMLHGEFARLNFSKDQWLDAQRRPGA